MGLETKIQADVLRRLMRDDRVAWANRCNTGKTLIGKQMIEFGLGKGTSDIVGQLVSGEILAIEVKTEKGKLSEEQGRWLARVHMHGGCVGVARRVDDVDRILGAFMRFDILLEHWALWRLKGGIVSKRDLKGLCAPESNWQGECDNKKDGVGIFDDDEIKELNKSFISNLSDTQKRIMVIHYRLSPEIPVLKTQNGRAAYAGINVGHYRKILHDSRRVLRLKHSRPYL